MPNPDDKTMRVTAQKCPVCEGTKKMTVKKFLAVGMYAAHLEPCNVCDEKGWVAVPQGTVLTGASSA